MRKIALFAAFIVAACSASPAYAGGQGSFENRDASLCPVIERLARTIMKARQAGVSYSQMVGTTADSPVGGMARKIIAMAHDEPRYSTDEYQDRAIDDFGNLIAAACYGRGGK